MEGEPSLRPDRFFILSDGGSVYYDDKTGEGIEAA